MVRWRASHPDGRGPRVFRALDADASRWWRTEEVQTDQGHDPNADQGEQRRPAPDRGTLSAVTIGEGPAKRRHQDQDQQPVSNAEIGHNARTSAGERRTPSPRAGLERETGFEPATFSLEG